MKIVLLALLTTVIFQTDIITLDYRYELYGGKHFDGFEEVMALDDGSILAVGYVGVLHENASIYDRDGYVVKFAASGKKLWEKNFGGSNWDSFSGCVETQDGDLIILGYTQSKDGDISGDVGGLRDGWIVKLDKNGNLIKETLYGGNNYENFAKAFQLSNGNYMMLGTTRSDDLVGLNAKGNSDALLIEIDSDLNIINQASYGGTNDEHFSGMVETEDGYLFVGSTSSIDGDISNPSNRIKDAWVVKLDKQHEMLYDFVVHSPISSYFSEIIEYEENTYVAVGTTRRYEGAEDTGFDGMLYFFKGDGTSISHHVFTGDNSFAQGFSSIDKDAEGVLYMAGYTDSSENDVQGLVVTLKEDEFSSISFGDDAADTFRALTLLEDNHLFVVGNTESSNLNGFTGGSNALIYTTLDRPETNNVPIYIGGFVVITSGIIYMGMKKKGSK